MIHIHFLKKWLKQRRILSKLIFETYWKKPGKTDRMEEFCPSYCFRPVSTVWFNLLYLKKMFSVAWAPGFDKFKKTEPYLVQVNLEFHTTSLKGCLHNIVSIIGNVELWVWGMGKEERKVDVILKPWSSDPSHQYIVWPCLTSVPLRLRKHVSNTKEPVGQQFSKCHWCTITASLGGNIIISISNIVNLHFQDYRLLNGEVLLLH